MLALSRAKSMDNTGVAKSMDNTGVAVHAAAAAAAVVLLARLAHAEIKATPIVFDPTAHPHYIQHRFSKSAIIRKSILIPNSQNQSQTNLIINT